MFAAVLAIKGPPGAGLDARLGGGTPSLSRLRLPEQLASAGFTLRATVPPLGAGSQGTPGTG